MSGTRRSRAASTLVDFHITDIYGYHTMKPAKTTVYLDAADYRRIKAMARAQGRPAAELVREAVSVYARSQPMAARPTSIAAGRSGRADLSERAEELLEGMGLNR